MSKTHHEILGEILELYSEIEPLQNQINELVELAKTITPNEHDIDCLDSIKSYECS